VIPLTSRLEFERAQREEATKARNQLKEAYRLLTEHEIEYVEKDPERAIQELDLIALTTAPTSRGATSARFDEAQR